MIKFVKHKNIDKKKWDKCIDTSSNQSVSAYSWYLDVVCANWSALILNDYEAVFPLPIKSKYGIKYFLQPLFIRCIGIYSKKELSEELVNAFFDFIPKSVKLIDFYFKENIPFNREDFSIKTRNVQMTDISQPYEILTKSYSSSVSKNLRKAAINEIKIDDSISVDRLAAFQHENVGGPIFNLNSGDSKRLAVLMKVAVNNNCGVPISVVNKKGETIAIGFFMKSTDTIFYSFGSANQEGKSSGAMSLMIDEIIKRYAVKLKKLDCEGSDVEGIANFNRNFGAKDCVYLQVKKNTLPGIVRWISKKG